MRSVQVAQNFNQSLAYKQVPPVLFEAEHCRVVSCGVGRWRSVTVAVSTKHEAALRCIACDRWRRPQRWSKNCCKMGSTLRTKLSRH